MNLTGRTKIQLFNAKTGAEEYVVEEKNMITNAVNKILSVPDSTFNNYSISTKDFIDIMKPFATNALGGILLFDRNIPEDVNQTMPPIDVVIAGNAGGEYAGANIMRGTYNNNESFWVLKDDLEPLKRRRIGRRHVWDFGTSKANGQIGSVCLTSVAGGNSGFTTRNGNGQNDNQPILANRLVDFAGIFSTYFSNWGYIIDPVAGVAFNKFQLITTRSDGTYILGYRNTTGDLYLAYLKIPKLSAMNPAFSTTNQNINYETQSDVKYIRTIRIPNIIGGSAQTSWFTNGILSNDCRYLSVCFIINNSQVNRYIIDVFNGVLSSENIFNVTGIPGTFTILNRNCFNINDDEIYLNVVYTAANAGSSETGLTGAIEPMAYMKIVGSNIVFQDWVRLFERSVAPQTVIQFTDSLCNLKGWLCYIVFNPNDRGGCLISRGRYHELFQSSFSSVSLANMSEDDIFPWLRMRYKDNDIALSIFNAYLGSINNLETPVVKTAAQTMKITYDLSWED